MMPRLLPLLGALLVVSAAEPPSQPKPLDPAEAAKQGRALAAEILSQRPAQNVTNAVLKIRDARGKRIEIPVEFQVVATETYWSSVYFAHPATNDPAGARQSVRLTVLHTDNGPNEYSIIYDSGTSSFRDSPKGSATMVPFAGSDFWVADLGLEFFHWPEQRLLKSEMRRGRSCRVLESINPQPAASAYSRVISWIDSETDGIVHAEAYDFKNVLLKEFDPKEFKKVQGQWQLQEMEISNRQTGSRTRIGFNVDTN
jgi:hypothetical protein